MSRRRYLTEAEVELLLSVALLDKNGVRNHCLILMAFRHGYRISELLSLKLSDIDLNSRQVYVRRLKNGFSTVHPLRGNEYHSVSDWLSVRESYVGAASSQHVFLSERGASLSRKQAWYIIKKCGLGAGISINSHPHMLRHACGYTLANTGVDTRLIQDYLGHKNIRHTVHYTKSNSERFASLWD